MPSDTSFSAIIRQMMDAWLQTTPESPALARDIYGSVLDLLSIKMRLTLISIDGDDPLKWSMQAIRKSGFSSRVLNINKIFSDGKLGDFKDRSYIENAVIPRYLEVIATQQPSLELVKTKLFGVNLGYDRLLLPQRNADRPEWIISSSNGQFMLSPPKRQQRLEVADEAIIQLLMEGATAKEIALSLGLSHRTIEHRLGRMKEHYGAKNTVHLVAMLISMHLERSMASGAALPVETDTTHEGGEPVD